ncbi:MAG: hypothetical protein Q9186_006291 [Xanthomendoza sp. 1 TL-2023]
MKLSSIVAALSSSLLYSSAFARYGLNPDSIPMLTKTVDYTFHSICDDYHNPVPTPLFDEQGLAKTIFGITNDLYSFLMGYSVGDEADDDDDGNNRKYGSSQKQLQGKRRESDFVQDLIDEMIHSTRRSELLESQIPKIEGPIGPMLVDQEQTMHRYTSEDFDCLKFQRDVLAVCY